MQRTICRRIVIYHSNNYNAAATRTERITMRKTCKNKKNTDSLLFAFVGVFLFLTSLVAAVVPPDTAATTSYRNINSSLTQYCVYEYLKASNYNVFSSGLNYTVSKLDENGNSNFFIQAKNDEGVINIGSLDSFDGNKAFYTGGDFCPVIDSNITGSFKVIPTSSSVTSSNIALAVSEIYTCSYEMTLTVPETNSLEFDASGVGISSNVCGSIDTQDYGVTYTMLGGGNNILGTSDDSFFFARVSMPATDFTAVVFTEDGLTNDDSSEPAVFALMVRDSMDPKSRQFSVVLSGGKGVHAFYRSSYGSVTQLLTSGYNHRGGCWLKITRISDNLKAYYKPKDKENFIFIGEKTIGMDGSLEVGLGLASWWGSNRNSEKVEFSNFVVTTPVPTISPLRIISPSSSLLPALSLLPSSKSSLLPSSFKCSITETMFNLELMTDYYTNEISWELIDVCCSITETVLHLELRTGNFEDDISWELVDVFDGRKVVLSANTSTYSRYELHNEIYCIEIAPCYQFLIHGEPEYKLFYNEKLLLSSRFDQSDISMIFGDSCSSSLPSMSPNPSALSSYSPTSEPSQSSMPSILPLDFIVHDKYNRRYFPERPIRLEESFPYQPVPNCTSSIGRVGCIAVPISSEIEPPHWVGTLYYTPPYCNNRTKECTVSIPIPRKSHTLGSDLIPVITNNFYERKLPGEHEYMNCVAVGDVNNDGWLDIVIATYYRSNQLLINDGDGNFRNSVDLPGGAFITNFVAVGDFNNDGWLDIVIGNRIHRDGRNQILINDGDGTFSRVVDLPSGDFSTESVAVGDINNDGFLDIVIGSYTQNNQLLINDGDGNFRPAVNLPGGILLTSSVAIGDMNNDGWLDIVVGSELEKNKLLPYSPCPNGGARLHSKSWCFRCPSFMGKTNNFCRECMPDYMQRSELLDEQCEKCPLGDRTLGKNNCSNRCLDGTYYNTSLIRTENSPSTWTEPRCESCSPGEYATQNVTAINECFKCMPGTYQPSFRSNGCLSCRAGEFQTEFGKEYCEPCSEGGYCNASSKLDGGFTPCPPGTFNDKLGQSNEVSCEKCPVGTFSTQSGANNSKTCMKCLLGTYNNRTGQTQCHPCDEGTFQSDPGQILCHFCPNGTYADRTGFKKCVRCPYPLSSKNGSNTCAFCDAEFYLKATDYEISPISIFQDPFKYCLSCPPTASCNINSSIQNIDIPKNYWRYSESTSKLYLCDKSQTCLGTTNTKAITRHRDIQLMEGNKPRKNELTGIYCKEGHTGPLCEICVENDHYFSIPNRQCSKCPSLFLFAVELLGICFGVIVGVVLFLFLLKKHILSFLRILQSLYPQAKVKLIVSFYQVLSSLEDVYGVTISSKLKNWMNIVKYLSLNFIQITGVPVGCVGSTKHQLIVNAVWPFMVIMFAICFLLAKYCVTKQRRLHCRVDNGKYEVLGGQQKDDKHSFILLKKRSIQWSIIVLYFALPVVSQRIFDAIKCRAFQTNDDDPPDFQSHLLINMSIVCNSQIKYEYASILVTFWVLFTVWILLIPLGFVVLLKYIGPSVRSKSISSLADASRFLWQDYDASMWFWDIVDTYRKIFLSGAILLIDTQKGSNKILRLVVAIIVSVLYFGILLAYRPYKRSNDYNLAFLSNFLLISCFSLGIILKLCTDNNSLDERVDDEKDTCDQFIGLSLDSFKASVMVVILSMSMLLVTVGFLVLLTINKITAPTVFMVSSGYAPDLELPEHCNFHVFMSHVWGTGQAKTHAITRNIQLFLPGLKVWLDVDDLQDISKLEDSVAESVVFVLYYSRGYFRSKNCRREIYAAMYLDKPIIVLYEGDDSTVEDMKNECMDHCGGNNVEKDCPGSACILKRLLEGDTNMKSLQHNDPCCTHGPIQWLNEGCFSAAAKNRIYSQILGNLPHYKRYPNLLLEQGIRVPGELSQVSLDAPINILTHRSKHSCSDVAEELKTILPEEKSDLISVYDARMFFKKNMQEIDSFLEDDRVIKSSNQAEIQHNDLATPQNLPNDNPSFLLLYLNKFTFEGCAEYQSELASVIQSCIDQSEISIVLVHEKDIAKGGCDFGCFFTSAPEELIKPPNNLFRDIATPLYKSKEYRIVSLRQILCKMGGKVVIEGRKS